MSAAKLMPCVFCGGTDLHIHAYDVQPDNFHDAYVECYGCSARGAGGMFAEGWLPSKEEAKAEAIAAWNRRATPAQAEPSGALPESVIVALWDAQRKYHGGEPCKFGHLEFARAIEARILGQQGGGDAARLATVLTRLLEWRNPEGTIEHSYIPGWLAAECRAAIQAQAGEGEAT